ATRSTALGPLPALASRSPSSLGPQHRGGFQSGCDPSGDRREEVRDEDRGGDRQHDREDRHDGIGDHPEVVRKRFHPQRPLMMPSGNPISSATEASAVACHATVAEIWRRTNPSVFRMARSSRRRRIDEMSVWASVTDAISARMPASTSGTLLTARRLLSWPDCGWGPTKIPGTVRFRPVWNACLSVPGVSLTEKALTSGG